MRFSCPEPRKQSFNPKHRVRISIPGYGYPYPVFSVEELGMMSPWLPLTIVAQVFMGSSYVYSSKWSTDMNLFYSLGDSNVFLTLQVYCRNAEAIGGLLGTYLFTLNPIEPFAFSTGLAVLCLVLYTVESAEAKRSRRKGINRVSSWTRKSQAARKFMAARKSEAE